MKTGTEHIILQTKDLEYTYEAGNEVLKGITIEAHQGESIGLIGANGIGKSTFLKLLVGLLLDYKGELKIAAHDMNKKNLNHIREHIGYVFQDSDNQLFMTRVAEDIAFGPRNYGLSPAEVEERVEYALRQTHIEKLRDQQIYRLSGGEKKLAAIATVLAMKPDIMLLDEPSVALDPKNRRNLINLLNEITTLKIIASHDLDFIYDTCDRTILMHEGRIMADGSTKEILLDKDLLEKCGLELPLSFQRRIS